MSSSYQDIKNTLPFNDKIMLATKVKVCILSKYILTQKIYGI